MSILKAGKLELILGCMFSGKTSELLRRYRRYSFGGKKCLLVKYDKDCRYSDNYIVTHDGLKHEAVNCNELSNISFLIDNYDIILIDEIQFFKDAVEFYENSVDMKNKILIVSGLMELFKENLFL